MRTPRKRRIKHKKFSCSRTSVVVAIGGILLVSGCGFNSADSQTVITAPHVALADQGPQQDLSLNGHAEPFQLVPIYAPAVGKIKKWLVPLGTYVQKGQKLADIDGGDLATRIKQAEAQVRQNQVEARMKSIQQQMSLTSTKSGQSTTVDVESAKAKVKDLEFALTQAQQKWTLIKNYQQEPQELIQAEKAKDQLLQQLNQAKQVQSIAEAKVEKQQLSGQTQSKTPVDPALQADIDTAKANVSQIEFAFANAQVNLEQLKNQLQQKTTNESQLAQAAAAKDQAEYALNAAEQMVSLLTNKANNTKQSAEEASKLQQQLDQAATSLASISVEQAQVNLESLQYEANNLQLLTPIGGFLIEPNVSASIEGGSSAKETPLYMIANLDQVYVKIDAQEAMIGKIKLNQDAIVTFPAIGKTFKGKVIYIGEMADLNSMTYPVRVLVENQDHLIRGGMRAQITLN